MEKKLFSYSNGDGDFKGLAFITLWDFYRVIQSVPQQWQANKKDSSIFIITTQWGLFYKNTLQHTKLNNKHISYLA